MYYLHLFQGKKNPHFWDKQDHGALRWLLNFKNPEGQIARWFENLAA
jgi:hypothetical protein